jgi:protein SCO1/2
MFFSHCDYACPKTIADMKSLLHALPKEMQNQVGMTLFSFDPKRDTYQRLDSVANDMELSASQWTLLTSTEPAAEELGAVLNVQYKGATDGQFSHSNAILILDPSGEVVHRQEGIGADPEASLIALRKMLKRNS